MPDIPAEDVVVQLDVVEHAPGTYYLSCRSPFGETSMQVRLPAEGTELLRRLHAVEKSVLRSSAQLVLRGSAGNVEAPVRVLGQELCDAVLRDETRELFETSFRQAQQTQAPFRLLLRVSGATLSQLPWEFLYDRRRDDYLALNVPVVRYLEVMRPQAPVTVSLPLRILGVISRPEDRDELDVAAEREALSAALAPLGAEQVQLHWMQGQGWEDLWRAARSAPWHILHFIGHGGFDEDTGEGFLELVGPAGTAQRVYATHLGRLLQDNSSLRMAVLNACESARLAESDSFSSPAASLIRRGFAAVVAMQYEISDPAALTFAHALYGRIAAGAPLDRAVTDARTTVQLGQPGSLEWGTPVLYLRSSGTRVFDVASQGPPRTLSAGASQAPAPTLEDAPAPVTPPAAPQSPAPSVPPQAPPAASQSPPAASQSPPAAGPAAPAAPQSPPAAGPAAPPVRRGGPAGRPPAGGAGTPTARPGFVDGMASVLGGLTRTRPAGPVAPDAGPYPVATADGLRETHRLAHAAPVRAVVVAPGGRICAGGDDGVALCWSLEQATVARCCRLPGEAPGLRGLDVAPDARHLAAVYTDGFVRVWDLETEVVRLAVRLSQGRTGWSVRFSGDGRLLVVGCSDRMALIVDHQGIERAWFPHAPEAGATGPPAGRADVRAAAFSPDGHWIATAADDGLLRLFGPQGRMVTRIPHPAPLLGLAFRPDGRRIATAAADGNAREWDATGRVLGRFNHYDAVTAVAYGADDAWLASTSLDGTVRLWRGGERPQAWAQHGAPVFAVAIEHRPGVAPTLATAAGDHTVRVWAAGPVASPQPADGRD